jgi:flagellar basal-body rod modification protein FlgD
MDQDDFLKLLIAQISNQDPLNPTDSSAFLAQMAQFSGLEQMINMNGKLSDLTLSMASNNSTSVAALIGKQVTAVGDEMQLVDGATVTLDFDLPDQVNDLQITIKNKDGRIVRSLTQRGALAGLNSIEWDGCGQDGVRLDAGTYRYEISGTCGDGTKVSAKGRVSGVVTGISYDNGYPELLMGTRRVSLSNVIEITQHEKTSVRSGSSG